MENYVFRDGYLLRLYLQRGPHAYYRCANRKNKCKVRLSINHSTMTENLTGTHLDSCTRDEDPQHIVIRQRRPATKQQLQFHPHSLPQSYIIGLTTPHNFSIPLELQRTADGQEFLQLFTAFPTFSSVLYTHSMLSFSSLCSRIVFHRLIPVCFDPFQSLAVVLGYTHDCEIRPISFFLMQRGDSSEFVFLCNYLRSALAISPDARLYADAALAPHISARVSLFHLRSAVRAQAAAGKSPNALVELFTQLALRAPEEALRLLSEMRAARKCEEALSIYDAILADKEVGEWNAADDLWFNKVLCAYMPEVERALGQCAAEAAKGAGAFAHRLQQFEFEFRKKNVEVKEEGFEMRDIGVFVDEIEKMKENAEIM